MRNLRILVIMLVALVAPVAASANAMPRLTPRTSGVLPDLLFLGGLKIFDQILGGLFPGKANATNASKILYDVYLDPHYDRNDCRCKPEELQYWFTVDATVAAMISFGDRIVLKVKPRKAGQAGREMTLYVNEARYFKTGIEGDKGGKDEKGKSNGKGLGYVKGYPYIWVRSLDMGDNFLNAVFSRSESCSANVIRVDMARYYELSSDEDNLLNVAGAGHLGYPYTPVFTAVIDNQVRAFDSEERATALLQKMNDDAVAAAQQQQGSESQGSQGAPKTETCPVSMFGVRYSREQAETTPAAELGQKLYGLASARTALPFDQPLVIDEGKGLYLLFRSNEPIQLTFKRPDGSVIASRQSKQTDNGHEVTLRLAYSPTDTNNVLVVNGRWEIQFRRSQ